VEDLHLYSAVTAFYLGNFEAALKDFEQSRKMRINSENPRDKSIQESVGYFSRSNKSTPMLSQHSSKTDLSDVGLCSVNIHEATFNVLICHLFLKQWDRAIDCCNEVLQGSPQKYQKFFYLLRGLLY